MPVWRSSVKRPYQITGVILLLFSVYIGWESLSLRYYTSLGPGPGFFPLWLAVIMGILSLLMLYHATFGKSDPMPADFFASKVGYLRAAAVCASMIWAVITMPVLGFRISMAVLFLWLQLTLGRVNPVVMVVVTALGSWGAFWVFDNMLKVPLPVGMFGI